MPAPIHLAKADSELTRPCDDPAPVPKPLRALTERETETLLAKNTAALITCRDRQSGVVRFYAKRDRAITGGR